MTYWIDRMNSCPTGYSDNPSIEDYQKEMLKHPLTQEDLGHMKYLTEEASESQSGYDTFPCSGGIDALKILIAFVENGKWCMN